jgi:Transposase DDE domain group 1
LGSTSSALTSAPCRNRRFPVKGAGIGGIANSDIIKSYLGLLVQGKNDFDAIEAYRRDEFFARSLGLGAVPSSPTLRQRMDTHAASWFELAEQLNMALLGARYASGEGLRPAPVDFGALACGYMPIDWDTFVMDNSGTAKQDVGRTYQGVDGYTPSATYMGTAGYCLELALRPGSQHSALETEHNLERAFAMAARLCEQPLLLRADSGLCSAKIRRSIAAQASALQREIAFIIKWNPRSTPVEALAVERVAGGAHEASTVWCLERDGKRSCVWQEWIDEPVDGSAGGLGQAQPERVRRIYRLTERTIDKHGQPLLLPAYALDGWLSSLPERLGCADIIALYADHATHEQFHSEFKTDMDLERLPSGKFDTNYLVCALAAVAMNLLRLIGQSALTGPDAPLRHAAKRRRIKTVMQELMFKAGRLIKHAGRWVVGLSQCDTAYAVFERLYSALRQQTRCDTQGPARASPA